MKKNNKKGFTLVELVIVVAVMAVLVAVAIPTVKSITGTAKEAVTETNCRTIESVLKMKEAELVKDGDGAGSLTTNAQVEGAIDAAKLGIQGKAAAGQNAAAPVVYYYDNGNGVVSATNPGDNKVGTVFTLSFDHKGDCSVTGGAS